MAVAGRQFAWTELMGTGSDAANDSVKRTLIVGLGVSGLAVARYLASRRETFLVIDSRSVPPGLAALRAMCPDAELHLGALDPRWLEGVGEVVVSPGLGLETPLLEQARLRGIPVVGEIELFARDARAPVIAVTGSNGKSTVVSLTADMLTAQGFSAPRGGNLGPPALDLLTERDPDAYVLEISSFQMETTQTLAPLTAAVLNVSEDHLDRHGSVDRYAGLKAKLLARAGRAVYNYDDPLVRAMGLAHPNAVAFSVHEPLERGYSVVREGDERWLARDREPIVASSELRLHGLLGEANALAALALSDAMHGERAPALEVLRQFAGLPHRCQKVAERAGVVYINDSKGTNVGATVAAIAGLGGSIVLIAGGLGKGASFAPLAAAAGSRLRAAVLIGEAAGQLESALAGRCATRRAGTMAEAVATAAALAQSGDTVLLSPACASQDMFADYRERGEVFTRAVLELAA